MAQLRDIEESIQTVIKTKKITQAMKMVAAAKFKRATRASLEATPYLNSLNNILNNLATRIEKDELPPHLQASSSNNEIAIIITGDRGLCGSFNSNIIKFSENFLKKHKNPIQLVLFGNKAYQHFKKKNWEIKSHTPFSSLKIAATTISSNLSSSIEDYENGKIGKIWLFFNEFASALSSNLIKKQLLPISLERETTENSQEIESDYFYEPSKLEILNKILSEFTTYCVFKAILDSQSAEEGARMASMDAATSNAEERIDELSLLYNRTRQAQITNEISEIVSGAISLVG